MGLSFLVPKETRALAVTVRWGDYAQTEIEGADGKPLSVWQRHPREATVPVTLTGASDPVVHDVPDSGGLQLHVVERPISAQDLEEHIPQGTRSVSVFLVNHRTPVAPDRASPTSPTSSSPSSRCAATAPSSRGRTCAARGPRSGTSRSPTSTTPTRPSTRPATASRPTGRSWTARAACSAPRGSRAPRWRRRRPWTCRASSSRWKRSGRSPMAPRPRRRCGRWWRSTATGSRRSERASRRFRERGARRPRSCCASRASPPTGSSAASACSPRTPTPSTPSAWRTAPWRGRSASGSASRRRAGAPSSSPSSC